MSTETSAAPASIPAPVTPPTSGVSAAAVPDAAGNVTHAEGPIGALTELYRARMSAGSPTEPAIEQPAAEATEPAADGVPTDEPAPAEPEGEPIEATAAPAIEPPAGLSEQDRQMFAALDPSLKAWLTQRAANQQADYTQKTQAAAEMRKEAESTRGQLLQALRQYDQILSQFTDRSIEPPDAGLADTDPDLYQRQLAGYMQAKHGQEVAAAERQKLMQQHEEHAKASYQQWLGAEMEKMAKDVPEFVDKIKGPILRKQLGEYAAKSGYSNRDMAVASARDMSILRKAMLYDAAQSAAAKAKPLPPATPRSATPGPAKSPGRPGNMVAAIHNLRNAPTVANLQAAYLAKIRAEKR